MSLFTKDEVPQHSWVLCEGIPFFCVLNKIKSLFSEREKRLLKKEKMLLDELNISMQD